MSYQVTLGSSVLLTLLLIAGCGEDRDASTATTVPAAAASVSSPGGSIDPCAIALAPHAGSDRLDQEIVRLQQEARRAAQPLAYLERLGWAYVAKARAGFDPGFYRLAEQCALCIEAKAPQSSESLLLRGHVLHNLHRFKETEALARELVARRGLSFDYGLLGDALMEQGKLAEAVAAYQAMVDQRPGPQAYSRAAHIRWLKGDLSGAIELMQWTAGATGSHDPEAAAWARVRLALYEQQAGHRKVAETLVAEALALQPDYPPALLARGRMQLAEGKAAEAVAPLARAAELNPLPEYQWALIEALRAAGRPDEAAEVEARLRQRGAVDDPRTFALYLATTGRDVQTALRLAEEELKVRADVYTLDALAWALRASGRHEEAHGYSERALAEGTQDARLFYHAGVIAAAAGRPAEARSWLEKAAALQRMLLPSERVQLDKESAALQSRTSTLAAGYATRQAQSTP